MNKNYNETITDALNKKISSLQILKRLIFLYLKPYTKEIICAIFAMIITASCSAIIIKLVEPTINQILLSHDKNKLILLPLIMISIYFVKGIAEYYQAFLVKYAGQKILTDMQIEMYKHLLQADLEFIETQAPGRLISRLTHDISLMRASLSDLLIGIAKHFFSILFLVILMFKLEPFLSFIVFFVFPTTIYPVQRLGKKIRKTLHKSQEELGNYTAQLDETFHSIKIIKSFCGELIEAERANAIIKRTLSFYKKAATIEACIAPLSEILSGFAIGFIIWYGGNLIIKGKSTAGTLFAFLTAFVSVYRPFKSLLNLNVKLQEGLAAAKRIFNILDIKPAIKNSAEEIKQIHDFNLEQKNISFENVTLFFGEKNALKNLSLQIEGGKTIAIVGRSGSGKTSITNLITRFYDPSSGNISIAQQSLKNIELKKLRKQIALVLQETIVFDMSLYDNIKYGTDGATMEDVILAAVAADAHDFICDFPQGYDTVIGHAGYSLSGGQRQRIGIARALLKNAPILILDEATSHLDPLSEKKIMDSIINLRKGRTTIIVTHRLQKIQEFDKIFVLKQGKIVEHGRHEELLSNKGEYYNLFSRGKTE